MTSTHCPDIDQFALVLRVDGSLNKFGEEGLARLRFARARRYITLDIQIPEAVWKPMDESQTKAYLVAQVRAAVDACVERLIAGKCMVDAGLLNQQLDTAFDEYLTAKDDG